MGGGGVRSEPPAETLPKTMRLRAFWASQLKTLSDQVLAPRICRLGWQRCLCTLAVDRAERMLR